MRIIVADDHDLVRDMISSLLLNEGRYTTVQVSDLDQALKQINQNGPFDIALLDYSMPGMNGLNGLQMAIDANGGNPVALLSGTANRAVASKALAMGAAGFVPKTMSAKSLVNAINFMAKGEVYAPYDFMNTEDDEEASLSELTPRENEVLKCLCDGKANKEIARELDLQEVTIKLHVKNLSRKLGARNRTHAAMIARDRFL